VLAKFGSELTAEHSNILNVLTKLLEHPNDSVRKRATVTIGPLVTALNEEVFATLMTSMIKKIESSRKPDTYIQTIGSVSQAAGVRVSPYLDRIFPLLQRFCTIDEKKAEESSEEDLELWESCLKSLEALIRRCPNKVTPYVGHILRIATTVHSFSSSLPPLFSCLPTSMLTRSLVFAHVIGVRSSCNTIPTILMIWM